MSEKTRPFSVRLPDELRAELGRRAAALGLTEGELGRLLLAQQLRGSAVTPADVRHEVRALAALVIAALSESIDLPQATALVADHLTPSEDRP